ncbi:MAG: cell division protein ZipA C-terminal FtsZ-binding domain-containing protein [Candidatus Thiodiazotropha sp.]|jgi:cell division protein ZipA
MDAITLRVVLLVLGVIFLAVIYLYETGRRRREGSQAKRRIPPQDAEPVISTPLFSDLSEEDDESEPKLTRRASKGEGIWRNRDHQDDELLKDELASMGRISAEDETPPDLQLKQDDEPPTPDQQEMFGFSAKEESPIDVPKLIIQINIKAKSDYFTWAMIQKAMSDTGLKLGKVPIYQRVTNDRRQIPLFNIASMVEPGIFPTKDVAAFTTPGLTMFAQLPAPGDSMALFSDMLFTAERLATILGGELQDETHSALTKQSIEHLRGQIMEHRRQVQLARSKH